MNDICASLVATARRGDLHHALILHGPSSDLLESVAGEVARALNCFGESDPDCACLSCSKIRRGIHPDVHQVGLEKPRKMISIEQIRTAISQATLRPYEGRTKVFIVSPAESMSTQAANSLLKTLEEPTRSTVFFLLTRSADRMLPTIRSRAQAIPVRPRMAPPAAVGKEVSLQEARLRAGATSDEDADKRVELARETLNLLGQAAEGDSLGVLSLASELCALDEPSWGAMIVAQVIRDLAGASPDETLAPATARLITGAFSTDVLLGVARGLLDRAEWSRVNLDPRLQYEAPLLDLLLASR